MITSLCVAGRYHPLVGSVRLLDKSTANNKLPYWAIDRSVCVIVRCPAPLHRGPQYLHALPCRIDRCLPTDRVHTYDILDDHSFQPVTQSPSPASAVDDPFLRLACAVVPHAWPVVCDMHWRGTGQKERPANIKVWSTAGPPYLFTSCRPTLNSLTPGTPCLFKNIGRRGLTFRILVRDLLRPRYRTPTPYPPK